MTHPMLRIKDSIYYSNGVPVFYRYEIHGGRPDSHYLEKYLNRRLKRINSSIYISCRSHDLILSAYDGIQQSSSDAEKGVSL